jgi:hypothetical protein
MPGGRWIWDRKLQEMVPADEFYARKYEGVAVSHLPCPMLISDYTEVKSMVDGNIYTSKSSLRRSYREKGYIEVGNEELKPPPKPKPDRKAIRDSIGKAFNRVGISVG